MKTVFISELKSFFDAVAEQMELYVPKKTGEHFVFSKYNSSAKASVEFNNIRPCTPIKEFLFPLCELAAVFPEPVEPAQIKPFAIFGLKDCDLRSIEILDKVFLEPDFLDTSYQIRRGNMFIMSGDCFATAKSCCCNLFGGQSYAKKDFDLNISQIEDGFIIETGSQKGENFIEEHSHLFEDSQDTSLTERDENRARAQMQLEQNNAEYKLDGSVNEVISNNQDSDIFDTESQKCVECQACTRICPTCHCFYLYDTRQKDYFAKMKMWDSCMRMSYAMVAGGANPNKMLGERLRHRLMHKFVYFLDRYGLTMCVGCGRCVDSDAGGIDLREILKNLSEEHKKGVKSKVAK